MHRFVAHVGDEPPNEIHGDDVARRYGFSGALVPGVELFARTTTPLVAAWGAEWLSRNRIDLRFRRPTYDGDELLVDLADGRLTVRDCSGGVRRVGSAGCWFSPVLHSGDTYTRRVGTPALEPAAADEALVRTHARELVALAAEHGIHALRFASPGRLLGRVDPDRDALDMAEFAVEAGNVLGAEVSLLSDAVLSKPNVSADLLNARAL
jgi:hypothetical protein